MLRKLCALTVLALTVTLFAPLAFADAPLPLDLDEPILTPADLTPADESAELGEFDLEKELRRQKIRLCEDYEWEQCPGGFEGGCACIVVRQEIRCLC